MFLLFYLIGSKHTNVSSVMKAIRSLCQRFRRPPWVNPFRWPKHWPCMHEQSSFLILIGPPSGVWVTLALGGILGRRSHPLTPVVRNTAELGASLFAMFVHPWAMQHRTAARSCWIKGAIWQLKMNIFNCMQFIFANPKTLFRSATRSQVGKIPFFACFVCFYLPTRSLLRNSLLKNTTIDPQASQRA